MEQKDFQVSRETLALTVLMEALDPQVFKEAVFWKETGGGRMEQESVIQCQGLLVNLGYLALSVWMVHKAHLDPKVFKDCLGRRGSKENRVIQAEVDQWGIQGLWGLVEIGVHPAARESRGFLGTWEGGAWMENRDRKAPTGRLWGLPQDLPESQGPLAYKGLKATLETLASLDTQGWRACQESLAPKENWVLQACKGKKGGQGRRESMASRDCQDRQAPQVLQGPLENQAPLVTEETMVILAHQALLEGREYLVSQVASVQRETRGNRVTQGYQDDLATLVFLESKVPEAQQG